MKEKLFTAALAVVGCIPASAQHEGIVLDPDSVPVEYANVALLSPVDSAFIAAGVTNARGEFSVQSPVKRVIVRVGYAGYAPVYLAADDENVGTIVLAASGLDGIEVRGNGGSLITRKVDRLVYNVEQDPFAKDKTALQLLKQTPRMVVGETEGTVDMIGREGVMVMINGRLLAEDEGKSFLLNLKAEDISAIEVIPVPPSKYHAQGDVGMINIRLRANPSDGLQGALNMGYTQYQYGKTGWLPGGNLNWHSGIWSVRLGASPRIINGRQDSGESFTYPDAVFSRNNRTDYKMRDYSGNLMIQVKPSSKLEIGTIVEGGAENNMFEGTELSGYDTAPETVTGVRNHPKNKRFNASVYGDIALGEKGANLTLTYNNHFRRRGIDDSFLSSDDAAENDLVSKGTYYYRTNSFLADFNIPVSVVSVEAGASAQMADNTTSLGLSEDGLSGAAGERSKYRYDEDIYSAYVSAAAPIGKNIYAKAGLRYEHTALGGRTPGQEKNLSQNYDNLFPTAYVSWNISNSHSLSLNYARRIRRPYFEDLSPFERYYSVNLYHAGNPELKPSASDNMELSYSFKGNLNVTLWGNLLHGDIDYIPMFSDEGVQSQEVLNCVDTRKGGLTVSYNLMPLDWFSVFAQGSAYYNSSRCTNPELDIDDSKGWGGNFSVYANLFLNRSKTLRAGVSWYQSLLSTDNLTRSTGGTSFNIDVSYSLLKDRLNIFLYAQDIFGQNISKSRRYYTDCKYVSRNNSRQRGISIGVTWNFGKRTVNNVGVNSRDVLGSRGI